MLNHANLGGKRTIECALPKPTFGGLRKWDWSGRCPFPLRDMAARGQKGGGNIRENSKRVT